WEERSMDVDEYQILYTDDAKPSISEDERQHMLSFVDKLIDVTKKYDYLSER
ncbi:hypothetical protein A3Q56_06875, partial [Intoshia linei]